ncbi:MAG: CAAX prenyl protease-related protein [Armatimonadetes bacterium]|nr:CAAX prenyl protease-related protein [Armatimonadota bacterium]
MEPSPTPIAPADNPPPPSPSSPATPWLPYVLPMIVFLVATQGEAFLPKSVYPVAYAVKAVIVTVVLLVCLKTWRHELRFDAKAVGIGVLAGLIGLPLWLGVDAITPPLSFLGTRTAYNPFTAIPDATLRTVFLATRFFGLAVMVPLMEEVFWRSFLLRFVTDQDKWYTLPVGAFSLAALAFVCAGFGLVHPEYLAAIVFALLMAGLLRLTKNLLACVVAHGVTNLALGIYVLATGNWQLW